MRRRDRYGYHTYYGGGGPSPVIKVIVIVLAIVVVSLGVTILALQRYMVYSNDGGKLVLPWAQETGDSTGSAAQSDAAAAVSKTDVSDVVTSEGSESAEPVSDNSMVGAVEISQDDLLTGDVSSILKEKGANGVIIEMKAPSGQLSYVSSLTVAEQLGTSGKTTADSSGQQKDAVAEAVKKLKDQGVYLIAYVDCFEDEALGDQTRYSILTNSGYRWHGPNNNVRWGSPTNADVRNYLIGIVGELAKMGFHEVLLDHAGYPTEGNLNYIKKGANYNSTQFASIISDFYTQASQAAQDDGAILSVVTDQDTIEDGSNALSGQTLEKMSTLGRVWLKLDGNADPAKLENRLTTAGMKNHPLGVLTDKLESDKNYCQAAWTN